VNYHNRSRKLTGTAGRVSFRGGMKE